MLVLNAWSVLGAGPDAVSAQKPAWSAAVAEPVFEERFNDSAATGLRLVAPATLAIRSSGVVIGAGPDRANAQVMELDLPSGTTLTAVMDMPETAVRGLDYTFCLKIETDPVPQTDERLLDMWLNHAGAADSIYSAEPLEYPELRDGPWLERATKEVFQRQTEYLYRGWTRYRGNTANAFLRRYDGRKAGEPLQRVIQLKLRNLAKKEIRVRIAVADVAVSRIDIDNLPAMKALLAASSPFIRETREQILLARERIGNGMQMPVLLTDDLRQAREFLGMEFTVPRKQAGWPSAVHCETPGCTGRPTPWESEGYQCPICRRLHTGERYDGLLVYNHHKRNGLAVRCLGFAWQGFDDERCARKAEEILLAYADAIADFKLGHNWLGDCWLMEDFVLGYDYIREWAAPATRDLVERKFLMPMVKRIHHFNHHYPEGYAGLLRLCASCAIICKDRDWIYYLVLSPSGNREVVLRHGLTADHVSLKGAAYHGSIIRSIALLGQSIENCGVRYFDDEVHQVYLALPRMLFPDQSLPAFGHANVDAPLGNLRADIAYRYYRDPDLLPLMDPRFREDETARIFWEDPTVPAAPPARFRSTSMNALGLTMLRTRDNSSVFALNWGAPQRNDPSRLDFQFYGGGGQLLWSSGICDYANPLFSRWYEKSVSRNGIVVDEQTQARCSGKLVLLDLDSRDQVVAAELLDGFPDTRWLRVGILLEDGAAILIDRVDASNPRTIDWVCHLPGTVRPSLKMSPAANPFLGINGYDLLTDVTDGDPTRPFHILLQHGGNRTGAPRVVRITPAPQTNARFFLAQGRTGFRAEPSPVTVIRLESATEATFATLLEPMTRNAPPTSTIRIRAAEPDRLAIEVRRGSRTTEIRSHENAELDRDSARKLSVVIGRN